MSESITRDGKCRVFPNSINKIKKAYRAGRGKRFNFKLVGDCKFLVYGKGQQFIVTLEEFYNNFEILIS